MFGTGRFYTLWTLLFQKGLLNGLGGRRRIVENPELGPPLEKNPFWVVLKGIGPLISSVNRYNINWTFMKAL